MHLLFFVYSVGYNATSLEFIVTNATTVYFFVLYFIVRKCVHSPHKPHNKGHMSHFEGRKQITKVSKPFFLRQTQLFIRHFFTIQPGHLTQNFPCVVDSTLFKKPADRLWNKTAGRQQIKLTSVFHFFFSGFHWKKD